jgi:hypothetical protein
VRIGAAMAAALLAVTIASSAGAVSLTLGGSGASSLGDAAQALYASDSGGQSVLITEVGREAPDGAAFTEIGVPAMAPDGRVLFGAEETEMDGRHRWDIFVGYPDAAPAKRVARALSLKSTSGACSPQFHTDPYPAADADGEIAFIARDASGRDTLFLYDGGTLSCLATVGSQTTSGDTISILSYGTVQMGENGSAVLTGWLKSGGSAKSTADRGDRQALFLASRKTGVSELAVEGELGPNRTRYLRPFGLPAALPSPEGTLIAFTAKTESGAALFLYHEGVMARILPTGTLTALGPVSYLSPGRPGLTSDGTTAVLAGCAKVPAIFRLARGRLNLRIQRGQLTPFGTEIESLGDPVLTGSGAMFVGATDSRDREKLYMLDIDNAFFEVGGTSLLYKIALGAGEDEGHSIFTGTLTANQHGDFAYLGGK